MANIAYAVALLLATTAFVAVEAGTTGLGDLVPAAGKEEMLLNPHIPYAEHCKGLKDQGFTDSGNYVIFPNRDDAGIHVFCDMSLIGGGWTVIQRRVSDTDFDKTFKEYEDGFGNHEGSFWLGLKNIRRILLSATNFELYIAMADSTGVVWCASHSSFLIADSIQDYMLTVSTTSTWDATMCANRADPIVPIAKYAMSHHNGEKFSTHDDDNDNVSFNCASTYSGGWWFAGADCWDANLNGKYYTGEWATAEDGLGWHFGWGLSSTPSRQKSALKTVMVIRPTTE